MIYIDLEIQMAFSNRLPRDMIQYNLSVQSIEQALTRLLHILLLERKVTEK